MKKKFLSCLLACLTIFGCVNAANYKAQDLNVEILGFAETNEPVSDYGSDVYDDVPEVTAPPAGYQKEIGEVMFWEDGDTVEENTVVYNGNNRIYNYCPSILQVSDTVRYAYYCTNKPSSLDTNLNEDGRHWVSDYIGCRKGVLFNGEWYWSKKEYAVSPVDHSLTEGSHICDPNVVKGEFQYNGVKYPYLMGYLATSTRNNTYNHICFAVSHSPLGPWVRCEEINPFIEYSTDDMPQAVVNNTVEGKDYYHWGYGQISMINTDKKGNILMFYSAIRPFFSGTGDYYWQGALTEIRRVDLSNLNNPTEEFFNSFMVPTGIVKDGKQVDTVTNGDYAYDEETGRIYGLTDGGLFFYVEDRQEEENPQIGDIFRDYQQREDWGGAGEPIWRMGARLSANDTENYTTAHNVAIIRDAYGYTLDSGEIECAITSGIPEAEFDARFPSVAKTGDDKIGAYRILRKTVHTGHVATDEKTVRRNLREQGLRFLNEADFSGIRVTNAEADGANADSNWWGYNSLYFGLTEQDAIDLSKAEKLQVEVRNNTLSAAWIRFHFIDADGDVIRINYGNKKGTFTPFGGNQSAVDSSSDFRGIHIGNGSSVASGVLAGNRETDFVYHEKGVSSADGTFDWSKVRFCEMRIHNYEAKSFDVGSVSAVIDKKEVVLFDGDTAKQVLQDSAFQGKEATLSNLSLKKNEWYVGAKPTELSNAHTSAALLAAAGVSVAYQKATGADFTLPTQAKTAEVTLAQTANGKDVNFGGLDGLTFAVDLAALSAPLKATFSVYIDGVKYEAKEASGAVFIAEDYTYQTTSAAGVTSSGYLPANFKGQVYIPFSAFTNGTSAITVEDRLNAVTKVTLSVESAGLAQETKVGFHSLKAISQTAERLSVLSVAQSFIRGFSVEDGAYIRLSEPAGLRFGVSVQKVKYNGILGKITNAKWEYGTIIIPDEAAYETALPYDENILTIQQEQSGVWNGNTFEYYAAIVQIHPSNYQRKFKAKGYFCVRFGSDMLVLFAQSAGNSYSVYEVAKSAIASGYSDEYLAAVISAVEGN